VKFDVSSRTIERDLSALQRSGVPIWAEPGRTGGYCLDPAYTLAPLGFTADEALAVTISLGMLANSPFREAATSALRKVMAVMDHRSLAETADLATRIHLLEDGPAVEMPTGLARALRTRNVLQIVYRDRAGIETSREIEPLGYVGKGRDWYLIAWCRLRHDLRAFKGERISAAVPTGERSPQRPFRIEDLDIPRGELRTLNPGGPER
jgi:predicted DNA-binding transcriptional regulator YafY